MQKVSLPVHRWQSTDGVRRQNGVLDFERGHRRTYLRGHASEREPIERYLRLRLRISFGCPVARYRANLQRSRHNSTSAVGNWQDCYFLHQYPSNPRDNYKRDTRYVSHTDNA
jgi:hypothetical protein